MIYTEVQYVSTVACLPKQAQFQQWAEMAIGAVTSDVELLIRVVDREESALLNQQYRQKSGPTNVLSFSVQIPEEVAIDLLGDLVICAPVIAEEAIAQNIYSDDHWAHIVVHGVLHLLGHDHIEAAQAQQMEAKEISLLKQLNIKNPYDEIL